MMQEKESGRILQCIGGIYTVATDSGTVSCKARGVFRKRGMTPYAGDFVTVEQGVMTEILPRKNSIIRPPLANLDQLLFVTSTYKPVPNLLLLDQFMAVAIYKQIQPVLVLTKLDLQDGAALQKLYTNAGIPVYPVCYDQPDTLEAVRACLRGKVSALTGNSGAGKSTLLNKLTGSEVLSEDKLFATLDPTTRLLNLQDGQQILLTDTVGFIHKLPHHLIEAFKSTLEEAKYADYIIHVVDSSNPQAEMQMHVVYETLRELGVMGKKIITLFNKQDVPGACVLRDFKSDYSLKISARTGQGLEELGELLARFLAEDQIYMERIFPYQEAGKIQLIREYGQLLSEEYTETGILVKARVPREIYGKVV